MLPVWFYQLVMVTVLHSCTASVSVKQHSKDDTLYEISENRRRGNTQIRLEDSGHAINCGPTANKMDFSWSPKTLHKTTNPLSVTLDMLATVDLNSGYVQLNVTDKVAPDTPIFQVNRTGGCQSLQKFGFQNLNCPVKANDQIKTSIMKTDVPTLPEGEFIIMIVVTNENKELFLCMKADVTIQP
ncbi:uncharacterized protein LOC110446334 [Mizuhopecten yessoensis]|uniref:MD-2-related lipid-recognition domain-containing protein n=1 Tax=Mizuhopecten yessoensis TaxID=6573 RepID=A0A210QXX7_MIZYE|nr:uncharacterized protein LOC110446334 [Mizuhopecten yessoensis]OWF53564.1 hypothetical protein KP79_PYT13677 [Mizuhopecten yessoensis]